ncbi:MAG: hypothetical protein KM310_07940 [Clostridiales bacterium]|nr:hypothetical protein [Clostridiales bacterium]
MAKGLFDDLRQGGNFAGQRARYVVAVGLLFMLTLAQPPSAASEGIQLDVLEVLPDAVLQEMDALGRDADRLKKDVGFAQPVGDLLEIFIPASEQTWELMGLLVLYSPATDEVLSAYRVTGSGAPDGGTFLHVHVGEDIVSGHVPIGFEDLSQAPWSASMPKGKVEACSIGGNWHVLQSFSWYPAPSIHFFARDWGRLLGMGQLP